MTISASSRPKLPVYVVRQFRRRDNQPRNNEKKTKTERHQNEGQKSTKKKNSVRNSFYFVEKNYNKKSIEGRFQINYQPQ